MKLILFFAAFMLISMTGIAQNDPAYVPDMNEHKIVIQLTSADTNVHKMMLRQIGNMLTDAPKSKIEVVSHSNGISLMVKNETKFLPKIQEYKMKGVVFVSCENTMKDKKLTKEDIISESGFVKAGILEIVKKQEEGWSYIRASQ